MVFFVSNNKETELLHKALSLAVEDAKATGNAESLDRLEKMLTRLEARISAQKA